MVVSNETAWLGFRHSPNHTVFRPSTSDDPYLKSPDYSRALPTLSNYLIDKDKIDLFFTRLVHDETANTARVPLKKLLLGMQHEQRLRHEVYQEVGEMST